MQTHLPVPTHTLEGAALDWAVATADRHDEWSDDGLQPLRWFDISDRESERRPYEPSSQWAHGGEIIAQAHIDLKYCGDDNPPYWGAVAFQPSSRSRQGATGPTALVAAMRAFVLSRLGETVEIPQELMKP